MVKIPFEKLPEKLTSAIPYLHPLNLEVWEGYEYAPKLKKRNFIPSIYYLAFNKITAYCAVIGKIGESDFEEPRFYIKKYPCDALYEYIIYLSEKIGEIKC